MALVIEDGSGLEASANSFADLDRIKAYLSARGIAAPADNVIEIAAIQAMDWIKANEERLQGSRVSGSQPLPFPRTGVMLFGFEVSEFEVPYQIVEVQCQLAADSLSGVELMPNTTSAPIKREKTGPVETEFAVGAGDLNSPHLAKAQAMLKPLCRVGGFALKVSRG